VGRFLLVCLGGAAGTAARYLVGLGTQRAFGTGFPYGTVMVNLLGSFLISAIMVLSLEKGAISPDLRVVLTAGVMGGFTTYSSFNFELLSYLNRGAFVMALLYVALTMLGCLAAGALGLLGGRLLAGG
jgi:fluoride exporter